MLGKTAATSELNIILTVTLPSFKIKRLFKTYLKPFATSVQPPPSFQVPLPACPLAPLIMGLLGTAGILATGVCLVLAALCRRHYGRPCRRPDNGTKHVPMEAVIAADDLIVDGSITGVRTPLTPEQVIMAEPTRNCNSIEGSDPDIIRNQYERRPMGFMKVYEPPGSREEEDLEDEGEEYDFRHVAKETQNPNQTVYRSLQRPSRNSPVIPAIPGTQTLSHKYRGPEVVTTSNRIQESCI
ncbi:hypothetical protein NQ317_007405 [Molorchus minor]|uniref:Uncharacterized protein n=1 Tax=Molorchus minor TaxID=1323400 RepID=A0ABQ9JW54_9CUCU|nr:hypothetical protein NQ317_007405 [Molorchus minor]